MVSATRVTKVNKRKQKGNFDFQQVHLLAIIISPKEKNYQL